MPKLETTVKVEDYNVIKPTFKYGNNLTSGFLKYFTFIPKGKEVKVTIEWSNDAKI